MVYVDRRRYARLDETKGVISAKIEIWREVLESNRFKITRIKIEYVDCNISNNKSKNNGEVKIKKLWDNKVNIFVTQVQLVLRMERLEIMWYV